MYCIICIKHLNQITITINTKLLDQPTTGHPGYYHAVALCHQTPHGFISLVFSLFSHYCLFLNIPLQVPKLIKHATPCIQFCVLNPQMFDHEK